MNALQSTLAKLIAVTMIAIATSGCLWPTDEEEVVVYTALDREFSEPILDSFTAETEINVRAKYDVESTKTVQLAAAIMEEQSRPRCDLFWNNEILHTLRLEEEGLLEAYETPHANSFPAEFRSPDKRWFGFAARVRVLIVNTDLMPADDRPNSIHDLVDPKFKGKVGVAKPLFGTTATHAAVLFDAWGAETATKYWREIEQNAEVMSGNKQVAQAVASGQLMFGITDTDDAIIEVEKGMPVEIVFPDQGDDQIGALFIPNTVALIKGAPHREAACRLIDTLLAGEVEKRLAEGASAQFPLSEKVTIEPRVAPKTPLKRMPVDFRGAAQQWETASKVLRDLFATGS